MTKTNSSTYPKTDRVKAVQAYLESGDIPLSVLTTAWDSSDFRRVIKLVDAHYNMNEGDLIGLEIVVRDAMQNMALAGAFPETDLVEAVEDRVESRVMDATKSDIIACVNFLRELRGDSFCTATEHEAMLNDLEYARETLYGMVGLRVNVEVIYAFLSGRKAAAPELMINAITRSTNRLADLPRYLRENKAHALAEIVRLCIDELKFAKEGKAIE